MKPFPYNCVRVKVECFSDVSEGRIGKEYVSLFLFPPILNVLYFKAKYLPLSIANSTNKYSFFFEVRQAKGVCLSGRNGGWLKKGFVKLGHFQPNVFQNILLDHFSLLVSMILLY